MECCSCSELVGVECFLRRWTWWSPVIWKAIILIYTLEEIFSTFCDISVVNEVLQKSATRTCKMAPLQWFGLIFVLCSYLPTSHAKCGGRTVLTDLQGTIQDGPSKYPDNTSCEWLIRGTWVQMLAYRIKFVWWLRGSCGRELQSTREPGILMFRACNLPLIFRRYLPHLTLVKQMIVSVASYMYLIINETCIYVVAEKFVMKRWWWFYFPVLNRIKLKH